MNQTITSSSMFQSISTMARDALIAMKNSESMIDKIRIEIFFEFEYDFVVNDDLSTVETKTRLNHLIGNTFCRVIEEYSIDASQLTNSTNRLMNIRKYYEEDEQLLHEKKSIFLTRILIEDSIAHDINAFCEIFDRRTKVSFIWFLEQRYYVECVSECF